MKKIFFAVLLLCFVQLTQAAKIYHIKTGNYIIPNSSLSSSAQAGKTMHSNLILFKPNSYDGVGLPNCETPASIACIYGLTSPVAGCPINGTSALPTGGWGAIALVEAYDYPKQSLKVSG